MENTQSILFSICDVHLNYAGCSNISQLLTVDRVIIGLHCFQLALCFYYLTKTKALFNLANLHDFDISIIFGSMYTIMRLTLLLHQQHFQTFSETVWTNEMIEQHLAAAIYIDLAIWIFAGVTTAQFAKSLVFAATGASLYCKIKINGKEMDPTIALKCFRLFVFVFNIILFTLFATKGIHGNLQNFSMYHRVVYLWIGVLGILISPSIMYFFGSRVVSSLKANIKKLDQSNQKYLLLLERSINITIIFNYWPVSSCCILYLFYNQGVHSAGTILSVKIITEFFMWFGPTLCVGVLIYRLYMFKSNSTGSTKN
ncbi:hypothetical protein BC833DRAFT_610432 [Globomyces pollinis-pini]|nr:hypothetical protein BC833DRAFT_610432 [Globomyces pollinis-pini]